MTENSIRIVHSISNIYIHYLLHKCCSSDSGFSAVVLVPEMWEIRILSLKVVISHNKCGLPWRFTQCPKCPEIRTWLIHQPQFQHPHCPSCEGGPTLSLNWGCDVPEFILKCTRPPYTGGRVRSLPALETRGCVPTYLLPRSTFLEMKMKRAGYEKRKC